MKKILLPIFILLTAFAIAQPVYFEDFENVSPPTLPANISEVDQDGDGYTWTTFAASAQVPWTNNGNIAMSESYSNSAGPLTPDNRLVIGPIDMSALSGNYLLEWEAGATEATSTGWHEENYSVYIETSNTIGTAVFTETLSAGQTLFSRSVNVPASVLGNSTVYIIFRHHNCTDEWRLGIDNIAVNVAATCPAPPAISINSSNVSTNSADISWLPAANETEWNIEYGALGFSIGSGTFVNTTATTYSLTGLNPSSAYDFYVQAVCDSADSSIFTGPYSFFTFCDVTTSPYLQNFDASSFPNCFVQGNDGTEDVFDWVLNSGTTVSLNTGPSDDITGGGSYIYIEASSPRVPGDSAVLYSPLIDKSSLTNSKLTFYSHMYGTSIGTLEIDVSDDGGSTYSTIYSKSGDQGDQWNFETVNLSGLSDTIIFKISATVGDNGSGQQWFGDIAIDNFEVSEALAIDVAGVSLTTSSTLALTNAPFTISGELNNQGINTVNSMDINYTINGGSSVTMPLTNLNFTTGSNYSFNHTSTWNPSSSGTYTVEIWASNINGANDMNLSNDRVSKSITVASNLAIRRPMLESFTSSTCGPCVAGNQNVASVLQGYQDNQYSILKYQADFPGTGDPYYTAEVGNRMTYYNVTGVPDLVVDGNEYQINSQSLTSQMVDNSIARPSYIDLSTNYSVGGQTVDFEVTIDPLADFTNLTLHSAIFEYITYNNTGSNGETEFQYVMKKMVPNSSGFNLNSLQDGVQRVENFSYIFNGNYILPTNANNPVNHAINHSVEDFDDLGVVVWIQNNVTKEILQSTTASLVTNIAQNNSFSNKLMIFPNPTNDLATIAFEGFKNSDIDVNVVNSLGEIVFSRKITSNSYLDYCNLDVSGLSNGIYNVFVKSNGNILTKKLQILR